jgi:hypothetical protein
MFFDMKKFVIMMAILLSAPAVFANNLNLGKMKNIVLYKSSDTGSSTVSTTQKQVAFNSEGLILRGVLHLPASFDAEKQYPTVVFTPSDWQKMGLWHWHLIFAISVKAKDNPANLKALL